jgi:hypothetical protein
MLGLVSGFVWLNSGVARARNRDHLLAVNSRHSALLRLALAPFTTPQIIGSQPGRELA